MVIVWLLIQENQVCSQVSPCGLVDEVVLRQTDMPSLCYKGLTWNVFLERRCASGVVEGIFFFVISVSLKI